jgi:alkylation response protein AidB-like acyl-CoA dehydrogenase
MYFQLTDEQREIKRTARDLLAKRSGPAQVREAAESRSYDESLWRQLCELGWPALAVPEVYGGSGLGTIELAIVLEELGYALTASPMLASAMASLVLNEAADERQRARVLEAIARDCAKAALGVEDELVVDAQRAQAIVIVRNGVAWLLDSSRAEIQAIETIDATRGYARVSGAGERLPGDPSGALHKATVAVAAELVGVAQRALDLTVAYVKDRRQFGVPIGAFQAISHRCAQMLLLVEGSRSALYAAAWAVDADPSAGAELSSIAKAYASAAAIEVTASAIQAHGGIGFTWDADLHWLYKRAQLDAHLLGSAREHRTRLAQIVARRRGVGA